MANVDSRGFGNFAPSAYFLAVLLMIFPPIDTALNWGVVQPQGFAWRFGAVGSLSGVALLPLLGFLLIFLTAHAADHRWVQRISEWLAFGLAILLIGTMVLFTLDALQVRSAVAQGFRRFDFAVARAFASQLFSAVLLALMAFGSMRARRQRGGARVESRQSRGGAGIVTEPSARRSAPAGS